MNFDLTEDQELLKALAERFVLDTYDLERRKKYISHENGYSVENWATMAELGLIPAFFSEENGGLGIDNVTMVVLFEALGRGIVVEPLIDNVLLAAGLLEDCGNETQKLDWLEALVTGEKRIALAHYEPESRDNFDFIETQCKAGRITGSKSIIAAGAGVDGYIVSAKDADGALALYLVRANCSGLSSQNVRLLDGTVGCVLTLDGVSVEASDRLLGGKTELMHRLRMADLARSAEALGLMEQSFQETLEYLRTRTQFGNALGDFQALQHRMVAQYAVLEQARSLLYLAAIKPSDASGISQAEVYRRINGVSAFIAEKGVLLGHEMIQLHGGMGVTDELMIGAAHKRLLMISRYPDTELTRLMRYASA